MNYFTMETWLDFCKAVENHIECYTVPQYGNYPEDPVTAMSKEIIESNINRYRNRVRTNQRGIVDSIRDCYKIGHYLQILKAREGGWEGERCENWKMFSLKIQDILQESNGLDNFLNPSEFDLLMDTVSRWKDLKLKSASNEQMFKPQDKVKHKKGNFYEVVGYGVHTETTEVFVVYKSLNHNADSKDFFIRPKAMFEDGRFKLVNEKGVTM